jgi:hypothetical protein
MRQLAYTTLHLIRCLNALNDLVWFLFVLSWWTVAIAFIMHLGKRRTAADAILNEERRANEVTTPAGDENGLPLSPVSSLPATCSVPPADGPSTTPQT